LASDNGIEFSQLNKDDDDDAEGDAINEGGSMTEESELMEGGGIEAKDKDGKGLVEKRKNEYASLDQQIKNMGEDDSHGTSFGDAFIHQMIETIEFVLGTVSNTASYLRLWALSLAHTELADTFLKLTLAPYIMGNPSFGGSIGLSLVFWPIFWTISFGVLMAMDLLECFLHTLRLHWVEFQNKFYKGDGYKFKPYSFSNILKSVLEA
jgi:vacuolar-type H+-ATPase subunit I/STV1